MGAGIRGVTQAIICSFLATTELVVTLLTSPIVRLRLFVHVLAIIMAFHIQMEISIVHAVAIGCLAVWASNYVCLLRSIIIYQVVAPVLMLEFFNLE